MLAPEYSCLPKIVVLALLVAPAIPATAGVETDDVDDSSVVMPVPDIRKDESKLKLQKRNWVVVPIPMSNPTLDTGLVLVGTYFYPQTDEQEKVQPPSVTGVVGFRSSNDSNAFAIAHQSYLSENKWRVAGIAGHADMKLELRAPGPDGVGPSIGWSVKGELSAIRVARRIAGKWYAGVVARYFDMSQSFEVDTISAEFNTAADILAIGVGVNVEYDNRDKPLNSYTGSRFKFSTLTNSKGLGSDDTYHSYQASYASYHSVSPSLVLAWELQGCKKTLKAPLWDACRVDLRGFSSTDYLGLSSASAQVEARWRFHRKWGVVAFAGGGYYKNAFSETRERELIPSYGIGLRFLVLKSQRINMRLDYGRSTDSDAVYLTVGEAF